MRTFPLIGAISVLILPFAYIRTTSTAVDTIVFTQLYGLIWYIQRDKYESFTPDTTEFFNLNWFDGYYKIAFGKLYYFGIFVLLLLIAIIFLSFYTRINEKMPALLLILCGVILFVLRVIALAKRQLSFYENTNLDGSSYTYIEVPIGFLLTLIFGLLDLKYSH